MIPRPRLTLPESAAMSWPGGLLGEFEGRAPEKAYHCTSCYQHYLPHPGNSGDNHGDHHHHRRHRSPPRPPTPPPRRHQRHHRHLFCQSHQSQQKYLKQWPKDGGVWRHLLQKELPVLDPGAPAFPPGCYQCEEAT